MAIGIPSINSNVYGNGVINSLNADKKLVVALLDGENGQILAISAVIKGRDESGGGKDLESATYYPNKFTYNDKVLTIPMISYDATISTVSTATAATAFAIIELLEGVQESAKQSYEDAPFYKYPQVEPGTLASDLGTVLIAGGLNNAPTVNQDSNFRLASTNITFSEVNAS